MHYSWTRSETLIHYSLMDFTRNFNALFIDTQESLMHYSLMDFTRNFNALFIDGLHKKL